MPSARLSRASPRRSSLCLSIRLLAMKSSPPVFPMSVHTNNDRSRHSAKPTLHLYMISPLLPGLERRGIDERPPFKPKRRTDLCLIRSDILFRCRTVTASTAKTQRFLTRYYLHPVLAVDLLFNSTKRSA